jgi:hypothetical protein
MGLIVRALLFVHILIPKKGGFYGSGALGAKALPQWVALSPLSGTTERIREQGRGAR